MNAMLRWFALLSGKWHPSHHIGWSRGFYCTVCRTRLLYRNQPCSIGEIRPVPGQPGSYRRSANGEIFHIMEIATRIDVTSDILGPVPVGERWALTGIGLVRGCLPGPEIEVRKDWELIVDYSRCVGPVLLVNIAALPDDEEKFCPMTPVIMVPETSISLVTQSRAGARSWDVLPRPLFRCRLVTERAPRPKMPSGLQEGPYR